MRERCPGCRAEIHHAESSDEESGTATLGMNGGPGTFRRNAKTTKSQDYGNDERNFHVVDGSANGGGAVNGNGQLKGGRNGSAELRKEGGDAVHRLDHVGAGCRKMASITDASRPKAPIAGIFDGIDHLGNVPQAHRSADVSATIRG